jgi:poly-gamma-glutamate synthesis protein (capsule biosynthesis protein)
MALYITSLAIVAVVIGAVVLGVPGHNQGARDTIAQDVTETEASTEHTKAATETETSTEDKQPEPEMATESEPETETEQDDSTETTDRDTVILFTGDVLFGNSFTTNYDSKGISGVVSDELLAELTGADILMINNEFPFSDRGTAMEGKQFTFVCSPSYGKALTEMGVDVVSLANNHTLDYGREALSDTFATLDALGVRYGGAGETVERAEEVQTFEVNGKTFGFLAVSRVIPQGDWKVEQATPGLFSCYDDTRLVELVKEAKETCDFLAVYPHWGVEYNAYPETYQTQIAKDCIDAGADLIVGSHTHCLQGAEWIDDAPVFYSLGNFMFGREIEQSAILKVTVEADDTVSYTLLPTYATGGVTDLAKGTLREQILSYLDEISIGAAVDESGRVTQ